MLGHTLDRDEFGKWVGSAGDWDSVVHPATVSVMEHMKEHRGAEVFGLMGFCWGGKIAMKAAALGPDSGIKATATVHPAMLSVELAEAVRRREQVEKHAFDSVIDDQMGFAIISWFNFELYPLSCRPSYASSEESSLYNELWLRCAVYSCKLASR